MVGDDDEQLSAKEGEAEVGGTTLGTTGCISLVLVGVVVDALLLLLDAEFFFLLVLVFNGDMFRVISRN